jgi:hypothetical protein
MMMKVTKENAGERQKDEVMTVAMLPWGFE